MIELLLFVVELQQTDEQQNYFNDEHARMRYKNKKLCKCAAAAQCVFLEQCSFFNFYENVPINWSSHETN